jgi:hypothetical protein
LSGLGCAELFAIFEIPAGFNGSEMGGIPASRSARGNERIAKLAPEVEF